MKSCLVENKEINKNNIEKFKIFGCYEESYECCLCGKKTYTDESYSNCGDRLICCTCYYNNFKNIKDAMNWIRRKDRGDE